jgi:hypothetical protein
MRRFPQKPYYRSSNCHFKAPCFIFSIGTDSPMSIDTFYVPVVNNSDWCGFLSELSHTT